MTAPKEWKYDDTHHAHRLLCLPLVVRKSFLALPKTLNLAHGHAQPREARSDPEQMGYSLRRIRTRGHGEVQENYPLEAVVFA
jgi:hypothetical protein